VRRHLEAVAKVDVKDLARQTVEHQVGRVAVAEAENVADHAHDGERTREVGPALEPRLRRRRLHPEHAVQVHPLGARERMLEDLDALHERERVEIGREMQHEPVLEVEQHVARAPVVTHERMERVALRHPLDEAGVGR